MITYYLSLCKGDKYIYTNGTYDHANVVLNNMKINHYFKKIYSRDTVDKMKPDYNSGLDVQNDIQRIGEINNKIIFFDDQLPNLETAKKLGWKTVWIHSKFNKSLQFNYVDHAFPTLISALRILN